MFWLIVMIMMILILTGLLIFYIPVTGHLSIYIGQEINLDLTISLLSIPIYSRVNHFTLTDLVDQYLKPYLIKNKQDTFKHIPKIKLHRLSWLSELGVDHASATSLSVSGLLLLKGIIVQNIIRYFNQPKQLTYNVKPNFDHLVLISDCQCMFSTRLGQAILMRLKR